MSVNAAQIATGVPEIFAPSFASDKPHIEVVQKLPAHFSDSLSNYFMFVRTTTEKQKTADAIIAQVGPDIHRVRAVFEAGAGDGTVLKRILEEMNADNSRPLFVLAKEHSGKDVKKTTGKLSSCFCKHAGMVGVFTNIPFVRAPRLEIDPAKGPVKWLDVRLKGNTEQEFQEQIENIGSLIDSAWENEGEYGRSVNQAVLVISRADQQDLVKSVLPVQGKGNHIKFGLETASQPWGLARDADFKARTIIAPLVRALAPGGKFIGIQAARGADGKRNAAAEIIETLFPDQNFFPVGVRDLAEATRLKLGADAGGFRFDAGETFSYIMDSDAVKHEGLNELVTAWGNAVYAVQAPEELVEGMENDPGVLAVVQDVMHRHGGVDFTNETLTIERR